MEVAMLIGTGREIVSLLTREMKRTIAAEGMINLGKATTQLEVDLAPPIHQSEEVTLRGLVAVA